MRIFHKVFVADSKDQIRRIAVHEVSKIETIFRLTRDRYLFDPKSTLDDDSLEVLRPVWISADAAGRWIRWMVGTTVVESGGEDSPLTTKGDLHAFSTEDDRLPVGADGQILYADSGEATGLKWDDPPSGSSGPDLSDADPEDLAAVASPGVSPDASRADHVHAYDGLATDAELSSEASSRASADSTLSSAISSEAATRASADSSEASTRAAADALLQPLSQKGAASGYASLDSSTKVVEDPASASTSSGSGKIPKADGSGKIAAAFMSAVLASSDLTNDAALEKVANKDAASGYAGLNSSSKVIKDPANATATPTASKIVIADASGKVDGWVSDADASTKGLIKLARALGGTAALPEVVKVTESAGPTVLDIGAIADGQSVKRSGSSLVGYTPSTSLSEADIRLRLPYFTAQSLKPSSTSKEELYTYPAPDFSNLNGGTLTRSLAKAKFSSSSNPANWGWDIGSAKSTILMIHMMMRERGSNYGFFLSPTLPSASEIPNNSYLFVMESSNSRVNIYKVTSGPTYTSLGTSGDAFWGAVANEANCSLAVYYDDSSNRLLMMVAFGYEEFWPILDLTDSSFTTFRYWGVRAGSSTGGQVYHAGCPIACYTN